MRESFFSLVCLLWFCGSVLPQEVSSRVEVTRDGVFIVESTGPLAPSPAGALAARNPNPTASSLRWVYPNTPALPWITESVGSGNFGTFAWLGENLNGEAVSLISATENLTPPLPIYEDAAPATSSVFIRVAAADKAPRCAVAWNDSSLVLNELRLYGAFAPVPATLAIPIQEVRISDDGHFIAAGYTDVSNNAAVSVYDSGLNLLQTVTGTGQSFRHHDISGDGSRVLLANQTDNFVFDVASGALLLQDGTTVSHDAHSIDFDGDTWGRGGFDVGVWKDNGGVWTRILTFTDPGLGFGVFLACDVSGDGSTFVTAAYDATNANKMRVYCWSLTSTSATLLWRYVHVGSGSFQDAPQEVAVSDDGRWIAVGTWGTQAMQQPEVLVFDRDAGSVPVASINTPGSCFSVDISGDGQFVVAGTKAVHANTMGSGGEGYSLDLGGQGHWLQGTPSLGRTIVLNMNGVPGDLVYMWAGLGLLPAPVTVYPFSGGWWLDPALLFLMPIALAPVPASGTLSLPAVIPSVPAAVGLEIFTQVARTGSGNEIDNYLRLPITP
ncbi:MAG: hypothetical protein HY812_02820 [Planctomycetes bacterium]|nr:hypothetical protein [Planctomycetota bacterium]